MADKKMSKEIQKVQSEINKEFGEGSLMSLGDVELAAKEIGRAHV